MVPKSKTKRPKITVLHDTVTTSIDPTRPHQSPSGWVHLGEYSGMMAPLSSTMRIAQEQAWEEQLAFDKKQTHHIHSLHATNS